MRRVFWPALVFGAAAWAMAQAMQVPAAILDAQKAERDGMYLKAWKLYQQGLAQAKSSDDRQMFRSMLSQFAPVVGDIQAARRFEVDDQSAPPEKPIPSSHELDSAERLNAVKAIVEACKGRQIVILNEEHDSTQCRAFGLEVARALRKEGFTFLAVETLAPTVAASVKAGYPLRSIGYYTSDPFFADFVRQSMRAGYELVEYETRQAGSSKGDMIDRINARETDQANNLIERVLKKNPKARVLAYVGYSHATKDWTKVEGGRELGWLAARLQRATGIDPLTIDQTTMCERTKPAYENMAFRYADSKGWLKSPLVFRSHSGEWYVAGQYKGKVDLQVFHPRSVWKRGRADWQRMGVYRRDVEIDPKWLPETGEFLVQAFVASEGPEAIAMDRIVASKERPIPVLLLPPGRYRIERQDDAGQSLPLGVVSVK